MIVENILPSSAIFNFRLKLHRNRTTTARIFICYPLPNILFPFSNTLMFITNLSRNHTHTHTHTFKSLHPPYKHPINHRKFINSSRLTTRRTSIRTTRLQPGALAVPPGASAPDTPTHNAGNYLLYVSVAPPVRRRHTHPGSSWRTPYAPYISI